jgi:nucleoside-diphosphate-sugar epimerase
LLVYGDTAKPIDQKTGASPMSGYGKAKLEAEQHLEEMAAKAGICFVSLRLPHVYGAHSLLFDQVRHGKVFFPGMTRLVPLSRLLKTVGRGSGWWPMNSPVPGMNILRRCEPIIQGCA